MFHTLDISASGLKAQRLRMDTIAGNIAQAQTTQDENGKNEPFRRKMVIMQTESSAAAAGQNSGGVGVRTEVQPDNVTPLREVYQPGHPHADANGMVRFPNVNTVTEFVNALEASRAYEANLATMDMTKDMMTSTFQILS